MSEENLNPQEEEESNPSEESETEDIADDDSDEETNDIRDEIISDLKQKIENLEKGVAKAFSERGRQGSKVVDAEENTKPDEDLEVLFFEQRPEAELVQEDLKKIAKVKGVSVLRAWREESWIQEKAKALSEARAVEEKNKSKISKPSTGTNPSNKDILKVKPEEVTSLSPSQKAEWLKKQAEQERLEDTD